jgi:hypothetical protein
MRYGDDAKRLMAGIDEESRALIFQGLSLNQMALLLEMDREALRNAINRYSIKPCGTRNGAHTYRVKDVVPYVVKPGYDIEEKIRTMHHSDLPKMLQKEFWAGQRSKQIYMEEAGDLWRTAKVVDAMGKVFKLVKMNLNLMTDQVDRSSQLSEAQRKIIKDLTDATLLDITKTIERDFKEPERRENTELLELEGEDGEEEL